MPSWEIGMSVYLKYSRVRNVGRGYFTLPSRDRKMRRWQRRLSTSEPESRHRTCMESFFAKQFVLTETRSESCQSNGGLAGASYGIYCPKLLARAVLQRP